ncbi:hypothetical protein [Achromobacter xylosoxidans]|uniref:hypothetical protein n=1 Tax=Alcaligenes xylosoxydans xylosoxydans TaxID=85698 RepID=UPI001F372BE2|nr:hypothetical protein [Achromobacter xylosoxidans]
MSGPRPNSDAIPLQSGAARRAAGRNGFTIDVESSVTPWPYLPMPTQTKSVDSKAAFELVFDLLQKIPWIVRDASAALPDIAVMKAHQAEAVNVILWICETGDLAGWPAKTHQDTQATASYLLTDLTFRLLDPASPLSGSRWEVPADQPARLQALQIVRHEVLRSKPITAANLTRFRARR